MVAEIAGAVNGITNLIGSGQQRKAQQAEHRNQLVQMVLASKMQNQQAIHQRQAQNEQTNPNNTTTYLLLGGMGLIVIILIGFIVWKQQQAG